MAVVEKEIGIVIVTDGGADFSWRPRLIWTQTRNALERRMRIGIARPAGKVALLAGVLALNSGPLLAKAEQGVTTQKTLNFSGLVWKVKSSEKRVGPGPNYFSDNEDTVWVDSAGRLHLKLTQRDGKWHCAEVVSEKCFGFGTYCFSVSTRLSKLDPNLTLGLFTWSDEPAYAHREIDIECGKWGNAEDTNNAQFVVQPYQPRGRLLRYHVPENLEAANYSFLWRSNSVSFRCVKGDTVNPASTNAVIQEWTFNRSSIPLPGDENARMNLWLCAGRAPSNTNYTEVLISRFQFFPLSKTSLGEAQGKESSPGKSEAGP